MADQKSQQLYDEWRQHVETAPPTPPDETVSNVGTGAILLAIAVLVFGQVADQGTFDPIKLFLELWSNIGTELISIAATILIIDRLYQRRSGQQQDEQIKQDLLIDLGSPVNDVTRRAISVLWAREWLQTGVVCGAKIWDADLSKADLGECDLKWVNFWRSDLKHARLWSDLRGANFFDCDLEGAMFYDDDYGDAIFDEWTILPDGTRWTPDTDMRKFTDPHYASNNETFWRSSRYLSPAYDPSRVTHDS